MAFLSIAGITVECGNDGAAQLEGFAVGTKLRAFDGTLRSTRRATKRAWRFTSPILTPAELTALLAATANLVNVTVTGDFVGNVAFTGVVEIGETPFLADGLTFRRSPSISIEEV